MHKRIWLATAVVSVFLMAEARTALGQDDRLKRIEERLNALEQKAGAGHSSFDFINGSMPLALPLLGIGLFCGFWARNSGRDFWLWFLAGLVFNVFTLIAILVANDEDTKTKKNSTKAASHEML